MDVNNSNIRVTNFINGVNRGPNDTSAVINNDLQSQAHELRNSLFNVPQDNASVNFRNLYDPDITNQLANMDLDWQSEFQSFPQEYGLITSALFDHQTKEAVLHALNLFFYSMNTVIATEEQINVRQMYELLQSNAAQVIPDDLMEFLAPRVFVLYIATPERLQEIIRFGDYVTIFFTFIEVNQPTPSNMTPDQQLIVTPLAILHMIDQYVTWMTPILTCRQDHITQSHASYDRRPPPPSPSAAISLQAIHPQSSYTHQAQSPRNYRAPSPPVHTFSHPPSNPPHPAVINYYQPPSYPYNYPFTSFQHTPTRIPDIGIITMA